MAQIATTETTESSALTLTGRPITLPVPVDGYSNELAAKVWTASLSPVRGMDAAQFSREVMPEIFRAAEACGADAKTTGRVVFDACADLLRSRFPEMGAGDISTAFQLAWSKDLGDLNLSAYRGQFTADILGSVLVAYRVWRRKVLAAFHSAQSENAATVAAKTRREQGEQLAKRQYLEFCELQAKNEKWQRWEDVPAGLDRVLERREVFATVAPEVKKRLWLAAKRQAVDEAVWAANSPYARTAGADLATAQKIARIVAADPDAFPEEARPRALVIYGKMLIFHMVAPFHSARVEPEEAVLA